MHPFTFAKGMSSCWGVLGGVSPCSSFFGICCLTWLPCRLVSWGRWWWGWCGCVSWLTSVCVLSVLKGDQWELLYQMMGEKGWGFPGAHGFPLPAGSGTSSPGVMSLNGLLSLFVLPMYHSSSRMVSLLDMMYLRSLFWWLCRAGVTLGG